MINVIDEVLNTGATDNKVKYKIKHADDIEEIVEIELATPVVTPGTPLNKALFDSIRQHIPQTGSYTGNGNRTNSQFANLGYVPRLVIVIASADSSTGAENPRNADQLIFINNESFASVSFIENTTIRYADTNGVRDTRIQLQKTTAGFTILNPSTSYNTTPMNKSGVKYNYVIFK